MVEVKCPYSLRDKSLKEEITNGNFYVYVSAGEYMLKESHQYYYQVQLQVLATDTKYCDFFVCTKGVVYVLWKMMIF